MYLLERDVSSELDGVGSALVVPCRFCPAATAAVRGNQPYFEPLTRLLRTASYERQLRELRRRLEERGIQSASFESRLPHQYALCMWSSRRRTRLLERARRFDAVLVMGCEAAFKTVRSCVEPAGCRVIQGMASEGIMSVRPRWSAPGRIFLDLEGVTPARIADVDAAETDDQAARVPLGGGPAVVAAQPPGLRSQRNTFCSSR